MANEEKVNPFEEGRACTREGRDTPIKTPLFDMDRVWRILD